MMIPEEEKAVLSTGVNNAFGELHLVSTRLDEITDKVIDLYTFVEKQQRLPAPAELQKHLDDIKSTIDAAKDNLAETERHLGKAHDVVEDIIKGAIG
jgi:hypothetical protein